MDIVVVRILRNDARERRKRPDVPVEGGVTFASNTMTTKTDRDRGGG